MSTFILWTTALGKQTEGTEKEHRELVPTELQTDEGQRGLETDYWK